MKFGSVCSGIEAASAAWSSLGWQAAWFSEIEPFPCAVLAHHYPDVPNLGDMTTLPDLIRSGKVEAPDVFCGGTPCQAFSVAGSRKSLNDARGNLSLTFCEIADAIDSVRYVHGHQPAIVFWENVPGVLSTSDNAFGCFLAQLCGGDEPLVAPDGWPNAGIVSGPSRTAAWRVLDAQYFGLAQRRKRVFVVASARNDFDPAAVLFEFGGLRRDFAPSDKTRKVTPTLSASGIGVSRTGFNSEEEWFVETDLANCLTASNGQRFDVQTDTFLTNRNKKVRRLTPTECERLQGFPDGYTAIPWRNKSADECPDGPRYKALGNSWAVPVVNWIGKRINNFLRNE